MGAGDRARPSDVELAYELGVAIAQQGWILLSGGRNTGIMEAVNRGAKNAGGLTVGVLPDRDKSAASDSVEIAIVTGLGSARNYVNVLSSDVLVACGQGGAGTASEVALALKAGKPVILLSDRAESNAFFKAIGGDLVQITSDIENTIAAAQAVLSAPRTAPAVV